MSKRATRITDDTDNFITDLFIILQFSVIRTSCKEFRTEPEISLKTYQDVHLSTETYVETRGII